MTNYSLRSELILQRIADCIGLDVNKIKLGEDSEDTDVVQSTSLIQNFLLIRDPDLRKQCLAFVEQAAASSRSIDP